MKLHLQNVRCGPRQSYSLLTSASGCVASEHGWPEDNEPDNKDELPMQAVAFGARFGYCVCSPKWARALFYRPRQLLRCRPMVRRLWRSLPVSALSASPTKKIIFERRMVRVVEISGTFACCALDGKISLGILVLLRYPGPSRAHRGFPVSALIW